MKRLLKITAGFLLLGSLTFAAEDPRLVNLYGPQPGANGVIFRYYLPEASEIRIAGDWSGWETQTVLSSGKSPGYFETVIPLFEQKRYRYKLIVDGVWQQDYANPNRERTPDGDVLSWFEIKQKRLRYNENPKKITHEMWRFYHIDPEARYVSLAGSFNSYNPYEAVMKRDESGVWVTEVQILPGEHYYCFVVDGKWKPDPARRAKVVTRFGQEFSIFVAE
jgi:1,4-alpha-glucan branching enzyme